MKRRYPGNCPPITLLTDFGLADGYVGAIKGVILGLNPRAGIVDIAHLVTPHGVYEAAFALLTAYPHFPPGTIHVVVVDPGVGGSGREILVQTRTCLCVGPDNGVFTFIYEREEVLGIFVLNRPGWWLSPLPSGTFHGRDVFAPVAAHLSLGADPEEMGDRIHDPVRLDSSQATITRDGIVGKILHVDRFGNLITNIPESAVGPRQFSLSLGSCTISRMAGSYEEGESGVPLVLAGSSGFLEIAVNRGRAEAILGMKRGDRVEVNLMAHEAPTVP